MQKIEAITDEEWKLVNEENKKIVSEFLEQSTHLSPKSIEQYESALKIYFNWIRLNAGNKAFYQIKSRDYLFYQNWLIKLGLGSSAVKMKRAAISSLNGYVELYYEEDYPTFRNYINKKIATPPPAKVYEKQPLTTEELEKIYIELEKQEKWQILAWLKFSYSSGCRRAEVVQLKKEIIDYPPKIKENGDKEIKFYTTHDIRCKGRGEVGKIRKLQFDQVAMDAIVKWLEIRGEDGNPYVFPGQDNESHVDEKTLNLWAKRYIQPILGRRFHPHLVRSSRATILVVNEGKSIDTAKKLLGHNDISTTQIYVIRDDADDADEAFA